MLKIFLISFMCSLALTLAAIKVARILGILDRPAERKIHKEPMPLLGGVAVFLAFSIALFLNFHYSEALKAIVVGALILMLTGLVDDIKGVPAWIRLAVQVACSLMVVNSGVRLNIIPSETHWANIIEATLTVVWIVGITNAINFMDGADGLASGIAAIASMTFFVIAYQTGQMYFAFLTVALAGACMGFLVFNFNPAKIFLGDAGSGFLGFSLASLAVMGEWSGKSPIVALIIPLLILAIPIFDIAYISISRIMQKKVTNFTEWIEYVGKDHLHHRLAALGFNQKQTVVFIYLLSMIFSAGALILKGATTAQSLIVVSQGVLILVAVTVLMLVGKENVDRSRTFEKRLREVESGANR